MKILIFALCLSFGLTIHAQEKPPIQLSLCAVSTAVNNSVQRYNGTEKGAIIIHLHANGTYAETQILNVFGSKKTVAGTYTITGNKIQFNTDEGSVETYTITEMDGIITRMHAGERTMYFIRSEEAN